MNFDSSLSTYECASGDVLNIDLDGGYPVFVDANGNPRTILFIEVYVSGSGPGTFKIVGNDGSEATTVAHDVHFSRPKGDDGNFAWCEEPTNGHLELIFNPSTNIGTEHYWSFGFATPKLKLKVKVKRQSGANSGACSGWDAIAIEP